jgi:hypothetical protein
MIVSSFDLASIDDVEEEHGLVEVHKPSLPK